MKDQMVTVDHKLVRTSMFSLLFLALQTVSWQQLLSRQSRDTRPGSPPDDFLGQRSLQLPPVLNSKNDFSIEEQLVAIYHQQPVRTLQTSGFYKFTVTVKHII